jgi:hypothetical protein
MFQSVSFHTAFLHHLEWQEWGGKVKSQTLMRVTKRSCTGSWSLLYQTKIFLLKGTEDGILHLEESFFGLCPSFNVSKKTHFGNWICFRPQVKLWDTYSLGSLKKGTNTSKSENEIIRPCQNYGMHKIQIKLRTAMGCSSCE